MEGGISELSRAIQVIVKGSSLYELPTCVPVFWVRSI